MRLRNLASKWKRKVHKMWFRSTVRKIVCECGRGVEQDSKYYSRSWEDVTCEVCLDVLRIKQDDKST